MRTVTTLSMAVMALTLCPAPPAGADDWPHWRGPNYDGTSNAADLPTDFSATKHVKWAVDLPGPGAGTPVVVGDRVFVSSADVDVNALLAMAFDRSTGKPLWKHAVKSRGTVQDTHSNFASPSPASDGTHVVFLYGNGVVAGFTLDGARRWEVDLQAKYGEYSYLFTYGASPTIVDGKAIVQVLQRDQPVRGRGLEGNESYLLALDPATGEVAWRHVRPTPAVRESREAYTTPIPIKLHGRTQLLVLGGDLLTAHNPADGSELWRWAGYNPGSRRSNFRVVPSVCVGGNVAVVCAPQRNAVYGVALPARAGDAAERRWMTNDREVSSDVPTPTYKDGRFYVVSDVRKSIAALDAESGRVLWRTDLPGRAKWRASPTYADGKLWCINHYATVAIVDADDGDIVNTIELGDDFDNRVRSSIVAVGRELFIRTDTRLFCIGR